MEYKHYKEILGILFDQSRMDLIQQLADTNGYNMSLRIKQLEGFLKELKNILRTANYRGDIVEEITELLTNDK